MQDQSTTSVVPRNGHPTNVIRLTDRLVGRVQRVEAFRSGPAHRLQRHLDTHTGMAERLRLREKRRGLSPAERAAMERCHVRAAQLEDAIRAVDRLAQAEVSAIREDVTEVVRATRVSAFLAERYISADATGVWIGGGPS